MRVNFFRKHNFNIVFVFLSPFYLSREMQASAEIICVPYNYVVDPTTRKSLNVNWDGDILIIDEAHNLVRFHTMAIWLSLKQKKFGALRLL